MRNVLDINSMYYMEKNAFILSGLIGGATALAAPKILRGVGRMAKGAWQGLRGTAPAAAAAAPAAAAKPGIVKRFAKGTLGAGALLGLSAVGGAAAASAGSPYEINP